MRQFNAEKLNQYPVDPGVYLMKDRSGSVVYVGKAKSLKARLKQYFLPGGDGRWMIPYLVSEVVEIETLVTFSEKEALLLENNLIKKYQPRYNALLKDDKTYTAIRINSKEKWPSLSLIRYKSKPKDQALYFGPYSSTYSARETLDLMQKVFPLRQCNDAEFARRTRPCILYGMKRCTAPCVGLITEDKYRVDVEGAVRFLKGQRQDLLNALKTKMQEAADQLEFEKAQELLETIRSVEKTLQQQRVDTASGGFSGDVLAIFREGDEVILSQLCFDEGRLAGYRHHNFSKIAETDEELYSSFLLQEYQGEETVPSEVLLPIEIVDKETIEDILRIKVTNPKRGERLQLVEMAFKNAEAAFRQKKDERAIREKTLLELKDKCRLSHFPERIECYDNSHLSGKEAVSAKVSFINGLPDKKNYRQYKLKQTEASDDYGAMREVLFRRFSKETDELPDLIVVDGGKGHLNAALTILQELNIISCDLIAIAKEESRHDKGATLEQIYLPNIKDPIRLSQHSPLLFLLQRIRDEAHRFAITFQKKRREKSTIKSQLAEIPGIGAVKQKRLLSTFGSLKRIKEATPEQLLAVKGIQQKDVDSINEFLK